MDIGQFSVGRRKIRPNYILCIVTTATVHFAFSTFAFASVGAATNRPEAASSTSTTSWRIIKDAWLEIFNQLWGRGRGRGRWCHRGDGSSGGATDIEPQNWQRYRRCVDLCNIDVDAAKSHLAVGRKLFGPGSDSGLGVWSGLVCPGMSKYFVAIALPACRLLYCVYRTHMCVLCPGGIQLYCMYVAWAPKSNGNFKSHDIRPDRTWSSASSSSWTQRLPECHSSTKCECVRVNLLFKFVCYILLLQWKLLLLLFGPQTDERALFLAGGQRAHSSTMTWPGSIVFSVISGHFPFRKPSVRRSLCGIIHYPIVLWLEHGWGLNYCFFRTYVYFIFEKKCVFATL